MNSIVKLIGPIEPKIRPLAVQIIFWEPNLKTLVTTWGFQNEQVALKMFYFQELSKHNDLKIQNCPAILRKNHSYIAASPNGIANCKCHIVIGIVFPNEESQNLVPSFYGKNKMKSMVYKTYRCEHFQFPWRLKDQSNFFKKMV